MKRLPLFLLIALALSVGSTRYAAACSNATIDSTSPTHFKILNLVPDTGTNKFKLTPATTVLSLTSGQTLGDGIDGVYPGQSAVIFAKSRSWSCIWDAEITDCWGCGTTCTCIIVVGDSALQNVSASGNP